MYQLEIMNDKGEIEIEVFNKQVDIVKKYGIGDRGLRNTMSSGNFAKGRDYTYRCTFIGEDNEEILEGKTERKPRISVEDNLYTIVYGKDKEVKITEEDLSKMRKLYCNSHSMTIEKLGLEMNLLREEVIAIKTAFNFVKTSIPYTDKEVDELSVNEMAEDSRIHKKKAYFRKLEDLKVQDMEKELKKLHRKDYYYDKIVDKLKDVKIKDYDFVKRDTNKNTLIVSLSDLHVGASFENMIGSYNTYIFKDRMNEFKRAIFDYIEKYKPERVIVQNLGDSINGLINVANRIEADCGLIDSIFIAVEGIANMLKHVSKYSKVEYYNVFANHSNIFKDKVMNIEEENFERMITWGLKSIFSESSQVIINEATDVIKYDLYGEIICGHHGHQNLSIEKLTVKYGRTPKLIYKGHLHSLKIETKGMSEEVQIGTIMGVDSYAFSKGFIGKPSQLITIVDSDWNKTYIPIYFD